MSRRTVPLELTPAQRQAMDFINQRTKPAPSLEFLDKQKAPAPKIEPD
jgi:hypothetical protein